MTEKHFKLREDLTIEVLGKTLYRIEATKDIEKYNIKKGELGGFVEKETNLSDNAWVYDNTQVYGNALVSGDALVYGDARVYGNARVYGDAWVSGDAWVYGDALVSGNAWVSGDQIEKASDVYNITSNSQYNITITPNFIKIGCEFHKKVDWWNFTDREIIEMYGKDALRWWKVWKPILKSICEVKND